MSNKIIHTKLPLLPEYSFQDYTKTMFHKSQCFDYKQGVRDVKWTGYCLTSIDSMQYFYPKQNNVRLNSSIIQGHCKDTNGIPLRPHFVMYDRACLKFRGYFQQPVLNTPDETRCIRVVDVLYFLEDDTVTVIEPKIPNSGLPQGRLVRRSRIPQGPPPDCEYLNWKNLNVGQDLRLCGYLVHLVDCDAFTKEFLYSQGVEVNPPENMPTNGLTRHRYQHPPLRPTTASLDHKLKQFLQYDGVILKFRAVWSQDGNHTPYCISYFLADDTIRVTEIHERNNGRDPFPILLKRTKLPKDWHQVELTYPSLTEVVIQEVTEFYQPKDLVVGQKITVYGRDMLIHMCDNFTRDFYKKMLNFNQPDNFSVKLVPAAPVPPQVPPYTGLGDLEDSLQSCLTLTMKTPKKDIVKMTVNANHCLRYKASLQSTHAEDADREFIISYSLADGTIDILEIRKRNSGHVGGRFLSRLRVAKPGTSADSPEYYTPHDFYIGGTIVVYEFRFIITGADLHVYNYMQDNPEKFRPEVVDSVKAYVEAEGLKPLQNVNPPVKE